MAAYLLLDFEGYDYPLQTGKLELLNVDYLGQLLKRYGHDWCVRLVGMANVLFKSCSPVCNIFNVLELITFDRNKKRVYVGHFFCLWR